MILLLQLQILTENIYTAKKIIFVFFLLLTNYDKERTVASENYHKVCIKLFQCQHFDSMSITLLDQGTHNYDT